MGVITAKVHKKRAIISDISQVMHKLVCVYVVFRNYTLWSRIFLVAQPKTKERGVLCRNGKTARRISASPGILLFKSRSDKNSWRNVLFIFFDSNTCLFGSADIDCMWVYRLTYLLGNSSRRARGNGGRDNGTEPFVKAEEGMNGYAQKKGAKGMRGWLVCRTRINLHSTRVQATRSLAGTLSISP